MSIQEIQKQMADLTKQLETAVKAEFSGAIVLIKVGAKSFEKKVQSIEGEMLVLEGDIRRHFSTGRTSIGRNQSAGNPQQEMHASPDIGDQFEMSPQTASRQRRGNIQAKTRTTLAAVACEKRIKHPFGNRSVYAAPIIPIIQHYY